MKLQPHQTAVILLGFLVASLLVTVEGVLPCIQDGPCRCAASNGNGIDFSSKAPLNGSSWYSVESKIGLISWNPCMSLDTCDGKDNVSLCLQPSTAPKFSIGDLSRVTFEMDSSSPNIILKYYGDTGRITEVVLVCFPGSKSVLMFIDEFAPLQYRLAFLSPLNCMGPVPIPTANPVQPKSTFHTAQTVQPKSTFHTAQSVHPKSTMHTPFTIIPPATFHPTTAANWTPGEIILLTAFLSLFVYFIGGVLLNVFIFKKSGGAAEILPQGAFWTSFPQLVMDGLRYISNALRGKPQTGYTEME